MGRIVGVGVLGRIGIRRSSVGISLSLRVRIGGRRWSAVGVGRVASDGAGGVSHERSESEERGREVEEEDGKYRVLGRMFRGIRCVGKS